MTFKKPVRAWQRMLSGRRLDLLSPSPDDIEIEDIAHGLARVARWNGQTSGAHAFSVAQHSLLVLNVLRALNPNAGRNMLVAALLHDAPEYVIGDLISPFKSALGIDYKSFELRLLDAIHRRFAVSPLAPDDSATIKRADTIAAYYEATLLAGFSIDEAEEFFGPPAVDAKLHLELTALSPWTANVAEMRFLEAFSNLRAH